MTFKSSAAEPGKPVSRTWRRSEVPHPRGPRRDGDAHERPLRPVLEHRGGKRRGAERRGDRRRCQRQAANAVPLFYSNRANNRTSSPDFQDTGSTIGAACARDVASVAPERPNLDGDCRSRLHRHRSVRANPNMGFLPYNTGVVAATFSSVPAPAGGTSAAYQFSLSASMSKVCSSTRLSAGGGERPPPAQFRRSFWRPGAERQRHRRRHRGTVWEPSTTRPARDARGPARGLACGTPRHPKALIRRRVDADAGRSVVPPASD